MSSEPSPKKVVFIKKLTSPGLRFWVIVPILILTALFFLILLGLSLSTGRSPSTNLVILVSIASFLAVVGLALLITRHIANRLDQISRAASQVAHGDFSVRVDDLQDDEISRLGQAFNKMVAELEKRLGMT